MTDTHPRDDLFSAIHKALRLGLFQLTAKAGSTDWSDPTEVADLHSRWVPFVDLLRAHTAHEDHHILRLLDGADPMSTEPIEDQHRDLDDLLDDLDRQFAESAAHPHPKAGLTLYRDLARFLAAYLPHLHDEETRVMARIWDCCSDTEIAAARQRFMAETTPAQLVTTVEYMLPALDKVARQQLVAGLAAGAPPSVVEMVLAVAQRSLAADDFMQLTRSLEVREGV